MSELPLHLNKRELQPFGFNEKLIAEMLGAPDLVKHHKRGYCKWEEHLYTRERILEAMRDPRFKLHLESRHARALLAKQREEFVTSKYVSWREALPEACGGMFSLNRYAKYHSCGEMQKHEVYRLKNELIEALYLAGYCTAAWIHNLTFDAKQCRDCGGSGDGGDCDRCGGDGIYQPARTARFWCFRFDIAGKLYCWHQPIDLVKFVPVASVPPQDWEGLSAIEKPLALPLRQFADAKRLIRWVIDQAHAEFDPSAGQPIELPPIPRHDTRPLPQRTPVFAAIAKPHHPHPASTAAVSSPYTQGDLFSNL